MAVLITVSQLSEANDQGRVKDVFAKPVESLGGYCFYAKFAKEKEPFVLSTYLSTKVRHFKTADALLKEAIKMGFREVRFIDLIEEITN